jgi:hypothetical protein
MSTLHPGWTEEHACQTGKYTHTCYWRGAL